MADCFIAKFTATGGPDPLKEIEAILNAFKQSRGREGVWFPTAKGSAWRSGANNRFVVFCNVGGGRIRAIKGRIEKRRDSMPDLSALVERYAGWPYSNWWLATDFHDLGEKSLNELPGLSVAGNRGAEETFAGRVTFAYWNFNPQD